MSKKQSSDFSSSDLQSDDFLSLMGRTKLREQDDIKILSMYVEQHGAAAINKIKDKSTTEFLPYFCCRAFHSNV